MSDDHHAEHPETDESRRVAGALAAFGAQVRPDPGAWDRIDGRLDRPNRDRGSGSDSGAASPRRSVLVAAAILVVAVLAGSIVVRARSTGDELQVATSPTGAEELAIVAVTGDSRIVELGLDGTERRELSRAPEDGSRFVGRIAVSARDGVVYVGRAGAGVTCGWADPPPEIVAVPFGGGEPRVVVAVGRDPDVDPATGRLAYLTTSGGDGCDADNWNVVGLLDPATQVAARFGVLGHAPASTESAANAAPGDPPWAVLDDVRWGPGGSSVWALAGYGSGRPMRALVRTDVTFDAGTLSMGPPEILVTSATTVPIDQAYVAGSGPTADGLLGVSSFEPVDGAGVGSFVTVGPGHDTGSSLLASRWTIERSSSPGQILLGSEPLATFDPAELATSPLIGGDLDVDLPTGDLLVTTAPSGCHSPPEPATVGAEPDADAPGTTVPPPSGPGVAGGCLVAASGGVPRLVTDHVLAAAWIRTVGGTLVVPAPPVAPPGTWTSTAPPAGSTPPGTEPAPLPTLAATEVPSDVAERSGRPDAAALVIDAYRAFFEQGDQSALEGSGVLGPALDEGAKTVENGGKGVTVTIDAITFTGPESAEVRFRLDQDGSFFTAPAVGSAVVVDGRWKVSAATMCMLLSRVQISCPTAP